MYVRGSWGDIDGKQIVHGQKGERVEVMIDKEHRTGWRRMEQGDLDNAVDTKGVEREESYS